MPKRTMRKNATVFSIVGALLLSVLTLSNGVSAQTGTDLTVDLVKVGDGFIRPDYLTNAGDGSGRLFITQKSGQILILKDQKPAPTPFLDIHAMVSSQDPERGLFGMAFSPQYKTNGLFFIFYTSLKGEIILARYHVSATDPDQADPASAKIILSVPHPDQYHNGGAILFGPDGYLYLGIGGGGDNFETSSQPQNKTNLLGKVLRIDVDHGDPYSVPADNPFVKATDGTAPEIWDLGLRNPWRFSFDSETHDMFVPDVGENTLEEVNYVKAGTPGGLNFGWNITEGMDCFNGASCDKTGITLHIAQYKHDQGCSIVGGYVYRGKAFPRLQGKYFYSDYCLPRVWALQQGSDGQWTSVLAYQGRQIGMGSFGLDEAGELYLVNLGGEIYHVVDPTVK